MTIKFTNNAETLLSTSSLGTGDTSVAVDDGSVFPALSSGEFFYATLIRADALTTREIVKVTARSGNTLTIVRAQDNTSALTFSADDLIELRIVAATLESLQAADELTTGDAAVTLATSAGNITIDAQGNDTDIILKGTDGGVDTIFLTVDGSDGGTALFSHDVKLANDIAVLGFGADTDVTLTHDHNLGLTLSAGANATALTLTSTNDLAGVGPTINLIRDSASPAASDSLGYLNFVGEDAGSNQTNYAQIIAVITNPGSGSEEGKLSFYTVTSGSNTLSLDLSSTALTVSGNIVIPNAGNIGSASDTDAIAIASNGVVTFSQIPVLPADTIDSAHYVDGSIDTAHIANSQITNALMADAAIDSAEIADGSIDTAHIADNQVTLAKMAGLARGKIIYGDASGDPAALAVGSANYVLTSDGTDISWAATTGADPSSADGDSLGTASAEWSDLYLADGGVIYFGNDQDTT